MRKNGVCTFNHDILVFLLQEEEESQQETPDVPSEPTEEQSAPAQTPRRSYRNREHFATIRTASLV